MAREGSIGPEMLQFLIGIIVNLKPNAPLWDYSTKT